WRFVWHPLTPTLSRRERGLPSRKRSPPCRIEADPLVTAGEPVGQLAGVPAGETAVGGAAGKVAADLVAGQVDDHPQRRHEARRAAAVAVDLRLVDRGPAAGDAHRSA